MRVTSAVVTVIWSSPLPGLMTTSNVLLAATCCVPPVVVSKSVAEANGASVIPCERKPPASLSVSRSDASSPVSVTVVPPIADVNAACATPGAATTVNTTASITVKPDRLRLILIPPVSEPTFVRP